MSAKNRLWKKQQQITSIAVGDLVGPLDRVIEDLSNIRARATAQGIMDLRLESEWDGDDLHVWGWRDETPKEREKRLRKSEVARRASQKAKAKKVEKDLALYKKLKARFETGNAL
jgi:hypothetical protein